MQILRIPDGPTIAPGFIAAVRRRTIPAEEIPNTFRARPEDGSHIRPAEHYLDVLPVMCSTWVPIFWSGEQSTIDALREEIETAIVNATSA